MADSERTIVPLDPSRRSEAAELLADAFFDDPLSQYIIPDESKRRHGITRMMARCLHYGMLYGHVETTEEMEGLAVWIKPKYMDFNFIRTVRSGLIFVSWLLGRSAMQRFSKANKVADRLHAKYAAESHWYLFVLAAKSGCQRRGVGTALMQHGLARIDAEGLPCYLETNTEKNVGYYLGQGFEMVEHDSIGEGNLGFWAFLRDPKSPKNSDCT